MNEHAFIIVCCFFIRAQLEARETEERLVRLEREATRDTEDSLACRVCPDLLYVTNSKQILKTNYIK